MRTEECSRSREAGAVEAEQGSRSREAGAVEPEQGSRSREVGALEPEQADVYSWSRQTGTERNTTLYLKTTCIC